MSSFSDRQQAVAEIIKKIRKAKMRLDQSASSSMAGIYRSRFRGQGMEFEYVREYQEGDDVRALDWNVTARLGAPYVKKFMEEREHLVFFAIDVSKSFHFGVGMQMKREVAVEFCAFLGLDAVHNNDRVGLLLFTDQAELFIPPQKGEKHLFRLVDRMLFFRPQSKKTNIASALQFLLGSLKKKATIFLLSDFYDHETFSLMKQVNRSHRLIPVEVEDPGENFLPAAGVFEVTDMETEEIFLVDASDVIWRKAYETEQLEARRERKERFLRSGIPCIMIQTDRPFEKEIIQYFSSNRSVRRR